MNNSNELENQSNSKGVVIFAYNTSDLDYVGLAEVNARLIKKHLNLPTTVITDSDIYSDAFDHVITLENNEVNSRTFKWHNDLQTVNWRNIGRHNIYQLSPYDQTLLIDADYIINSNVLSFLFDSNVELSAFRKCYDVTGKDGFRVDEIINFNSLEMYWATVIYFRKTDYTKAVFDVMANVKENWEYYRVLYNFDRAMYRNDYSFTIAVNAVNGFTNQFTAIPWNLPTLGTDDLVEKITEKKQIVLSFLGYRKNKTARVVTLWSGDLHIMNKKCIDKKLLEQLV